MLEVERALKEGRRLQREMSGMEVHDDDAPVTTERRRRRNSFSEESESESEVVVNLVVNVNCPESDPKIGEKTSARTLVEQEHKSCQVEEPKVEKRSTGTEVGDSLIQEKRPQQSPRTSHCRKTARKRILRRCHCKRTCGCLEESLIRTSTWTDLSKEIEVPPVAKKNWFPPESPIKITSTQRQHSVETLTQVEDISRPNSTDWSSTAYLQPPSDTGRGELSCLARCETL